MNCLPKDMGWGGLVYVYPLIIPPSVAAMTILVATIIHLKRLASARGESQPPRYEQAANRLAHSATISQDLTRELVREVVSIIAFSGIVLVLCPIVGIILAVLAPSFMSAIQNDLLLGIDTSLLRISGSLFVTEIVWQYWTRKITRAGSLLSQRPIGCHLFILALVALAAMILWSLA